MILPSYYMFCVRVKTISGHRALEKIPAALGQFKAKKPMIITDKGVSGAGLIRLVTNALKGSKVKVGAVYDEVPPDSELSVVQQAARVYRARGCDSIIAVGGGSVMDTSKGVNILVTMGGDDLMSYAGSGSAKQPLKPLIAIPTTSGTGSEVTIAAVIADHKRHAKLTFSSYFMLPNVAVLDSRMTKTLPPAITAFTGMDALTHACEAYTCLGKNPLSDSAALIAIKLISENLLKAIKKPADLDARLALANGANIAGASFSNALIGMVHTIGHSIGGVCRVPHGVCMAIMLPYGLEYNLHKSGRFTAELLLALAGPEVYAQTPKKERAEKAIACIRKLNDDLHQATGGRHPRFLKEVFDREGKQMVPREKIPEIARTAMGDGTQFFNPEDLDYRDYVMVLEHAWEGIPLDRSKIKKGGKWQSPEF